MREAGFLKAATALGVVVGLVLAPVGIGAAAKPDQPKPKPKPKLELLTESQEAALSKGAIKVAVASKRGDEARVKAILVVDGFPDDFTFRLGPESKRLRNRKANVRLKLSARQREVLAFAAQACDEATLAAEARAARRTGTLAAQLRSEDC